MKKQTLLKFHLISNQRGSVLLIAYFIIIVLLGIGASFAMLAASEAKTAERQRLTAVAFHLAETGIERGLADLRQDFISNGTLNSWVDGNIHGYAVGPNTGSYYTIPYTGTLLNNGIYTVELKNVAGVPEDIWVRSTGTINGVVQTLTVYVKLYSVSPWNYAIFAGSGTPGKMVKGNVDIRGSVLLLGDDLDPGDLAIDLGGTAEFVGNNYRTLDSSLKVKVPPLPTVVVGGETVETLHAKLYVKKGIIGLSGSSSVGEPNTTGNIYKETTDGVFSNDGFGGNQGAANVFSDNGTTNPYNLPDTVKFPKLTGEPYMGYSSYQEYLNNNSDKHITGDLLQTDTTYNDPAAPFYWNPATGEMRIDGIVYIDGNFNFPDKSKPVTYTGKGSLLVTGNITIGANFLTNGDNSFPQNNIGFMTPHDITLGTSSQLDLMGLFYAENEIKWDKQTNIMGTVVAKTFNMQTNVPKIYQVPEVINNLPPGMIGGNSLWYMVVGWIKS